MHYRALGRGDNRFDELEVCRDHSVGEELLSVAEENGIYPKCQTIEKLIGEERLHEIEAADDVDVLVPVAQFMHGLDYIRTEQSGVVPLEDRILARGHVLRNTVEQLRSVSVLVRPIGCKNVIGPAPEHKGIHLRQSGTDLLVDDVVPKGRLLTAEHESALGVLLWPSRGLRYSVKGDERVDMDECHAVFLPSRPSSIRQRNHFEGDTGMRSMQRVSTDGDGRTRRRPRLL